MVALLITAGCTVGPSSDPGAADERVATVRELRRAVGPAATAFGTTVATVADRLDDLHAAWPLDPAERRARIDAVADQLPALREAGTALAGALAGDVSGADAEATQAAVADAVAAGERFEHAAGADLDRARLATDAELRLQELVETWHEPGSRREQLARLDATASAAAALAEELSATEDLPACTQLVARREAAARTVADRTRQLRELVAARRGREFDERRRAFAADPYAAGAPLAEADRDELDCWRAQAPAVGRARDVRAALEGVEAALNPADLAPDAGS